MYVYLNLYVPTQGRPVKVIFCTLFVLFYPQPICFHLASYLVLPPRSCSLNSICKLTETQTSLCGEPIMGFLHEPFWPSQEISQQTSPSSYPVLIFCTRLSQLYRTFVLQHLDNPLKITIIFS